MIIIFPKGSVKMNEINIHKISERVLENTLITGVSMLAGLTIGAAVGIGVSKKIHKKLSPVKKGAIMALDILGKTMSDVSQNIN